MTSAIDIVRQYFDAWDAHDLAKIESLFAPQGTYCDPTTSGDLSGQQIVDYAKLLYAAFPDLKIELVCTGLASNGAIVAPWIIYATHDGPLGDTPASHKKLVLEGCDFIDVEEEKISSVRGFFSVDKIAALSA